MEEIYKLLLEIMTKIFDILIFSIGYYIGKKFGRDDVIEVLQLSGKIYLVKDILIKNKMYSKGEGISGD